MIMIKDPSIEEATELQRKWENVMNCIKKAKETLEIGYAKRYKFSLLDRYTTKGL